MSAQTGVGLLLALVSTTLTNLGYVREHEAAAALPCLSVRRPLHSLTLLLTNQRWVRGFARKQADFSSTWQRSRWLRSRWSKASAPGASACSPSRLRA